MKQRRFTPALRGASPGVTLSEVEVPDPTAAATFRDRPGLSKPVTRAAPAVRAHDHPRSSRAEPEETRKGALRAANAAQVLRHLARLGRGNPGNVAPAGESGSELKNDVGAGYRVYFGQRGQDLVVILGGGDKSSRERDIKAAEKLWVEWKEQNR